MNITRAAPALVRRRTRLASCRRRDATAVAIGAALLLGSPALARGAELGPIALDGWEVRWGDGPSGEPVPPPPFGAEPDRDWAPAVMPVVRSGRAEPRTAWLRRRLPDGRLRDPVLLARAVDQTLEVWVDGQRVYRLGDLEGGREVFATAAWSHLVALPDDFAGREVTLRIRSAYSRAGIGEVRVGPRAALVRDLLVEDLPWLVFGLLALFTGVLETVAFLRRRGQRLHLAFGGFGLAIGVFLLSQTVLAQLVLDAPAVWTRLVFASLFLTPVGALAFVEELFGPGPGSLLRRARHACVAYAAGALGLAGLGVVSLTATLPPFLVLLAATATVTAALTLRAALRGSREGRILLLGMAGLFVATLNDILVSLGLVTWLVRLIDEATFFFLVSLGGIAAYRLTRIHDRLESYSRALERKNAELTRLTDGLEEMVEARTRELETARDELELRNRDLAEKNTLLGERAARDSLTGLLNHGAFMAELDALLRSRRSDFPVSVVMLDADHFKAINDGFGHQAGDEVLRQIAATLRETVRESDRAARYGGEEFALLLPRCPPAAAEQAAERLRAAVAAIRLPGAPGLRVTVSVGITAAAELGARVDAGALIGSADEALYLAKTTGRDRVCFLPCGVRAAS